MQNPVIRKSYEGFDLQHSGLVCVMQHYCVGQCVCVRVCYKLCNRVHGTYTEFFL